MRKPTSIWTDWAIMPPKITVLISPTNQPTLAKPFGMARQPVPKMHFSSSMKASWSLKDKYNSVIDQLYTYIYIYSNRISYVIGPFATFVRNSEIPLKEQRLMDYILFSSYSELTPDASKANMQLHKRVCRGCDPESWLISWIDWLLRLLYIYIDIYKYIYIYCLLYSFTQFSAPTQLPIMQIG